MNNIWAMTEAAQRRVAHCDRRCVNTVRYTVQSPLMNIDAETILLITIILILLYSKANPMLLLAIMYVMM